MIDRHFTTTRKGKVAKFHFQRKTVEIELVKPSPRKEPKSGPSSDEDRAASVHVFVDGVPLEVHNSSLIEACLVCWPIPAAPSDEPKSEHSSEDHILVYSQPAHALCYDNRVLDTKDELWNWTATHEQAREFELRFCLPASYDKLRKSLEESDAAPFSLLNVSPDATRDKSVYTRDMRLVGRMRPCLDGMEFSLHCDGQLIGPSDSHLAVAKIAGHLRRSLLHEPQQT
ncbi:MAG: hypothetical protein MHM6MM_004746 [Cercozoa sp. M6MM]